MGCWTAVIELLKVLAEFAWPATLLGFVWWFNKPILNVFYAVKRQIDRGASVKYGDLELHGITLGNFPLADSSVYERVAADDLMLTTRTNLYQSQKNIFLVHRAIETGDVHPKTKFSLYDISVYLVTHKTYGALNEIREVEYYFGKYFGDDISLNGSKYIVKNSKNGFAVRTTAYGPTLCEARINFHDGSSVIVNRYLDFEGTGYMFDPNVNDYDAGRSV
ncbi:hypothetical protein LXM94_01585 [Rhizobium sp. TRM95111]|uniref:pYEATS domain-containing protein n=1 Tax=Rhizobium alarense TaxID=2846851 RepID=UPI001F2F9D47|nr:pYEATS domain-containing protein [Rhizobium alarense]MCF3638662.1 hypothetical protein [Rhizobium alarense]